MTTQDSFWKHVKVGEKEECWPWIGGITGAGYGQCYFFGRYDAMGAHRVAWILSNGKIPSNLWVLHKCDNRSCCNPNHLYLGTPKQNQKDRDERNPVSANAFAHGKARFYEGEIWLIRRLKAPSDKGYPHKYKFPLADVAKMFKASASTISEIWRSDIYLCKEGYYV